MLVLGTNDVVVRVQVSLSAGFLLFSGLFWFMFLYRAIWVYCLICLLGLFALAYFSVFLYDLYCSYSGKGINYIYIGASTHFIYFFGSVLPYKSIVIYPDELSIFWPNDSGISIFEAVKFLNLFPHLLDGFLSTSLLQLRYTIRELFELLEKKNFFSFLFVKNWENLTGLSILL